MYDEVLTLRPSPNPHRRHGRASPAGRSSPTGRSSPAPTRNSGTRLSRAEASAQLLAASSPKRSLAPEPEPEPESQIAIVLTLSVELVGR